VIDLARRIHLGVRKPANWAQLVRYGFVGTSGYLLNLIVFAGLVKGAGIHHLVAAVCAFVFAVTNNFVLNRRWTFDARDGHAGFQAARFLTVSVCGLVLNLSILETLVAAADMDKILAQALALAAVAPFTFVLNKLWSFG
jgi:dolichol-phosphate mannosyltransferase